MIQTTSEENYLKTIFHHTGIGNQSVTTNDIAATLGTKAASVTEMLKKLAAQKLIRYKKYNGVTLTDSGKQQALLIIRKHRLWEYFLVEKLKFSWDEIHEVAEQLEHIQSDALVERLDSFLENPKFDPHGDPIPDKKGIIINTDSQNLIDLSEKKEAIVNLVSDQPELLRHLSKIGISLGSKLKVLEKIPFDNSMLLQINGKSKVQVSADIAKNIRVQI